MSACCWRPAHNQSHGCKGGNHVRQGLGESRCKRGAPHGDNVAGPEVAGDARSDGEIHERVVFAGAVVPGGVRLRQGVHPHRCGWQRLHRLLFRHLRHRAGPLPSQGHRGGAAGGRRADERPRLHHADQNAAAGEAGRDHAGRRRQEARRHAALRLGHDCRRGRAAPDACGNRQVRVHLVPPRFSRQDHGRGRPGADGREPGAARARLLPRAARLLLPLRVPAEIPRLRPAVRGLHPHRAQRGDRGPRGRDCLRADPGLGGQRRAAGWLDPEDPCAVRRVRHPDDGGRGADLHGRAPARCSRWSTGTPCRM